MAAPPCPTFTWKLLTFHPDSPGGRATTAACPGGGSRGLWPSTQAGCWASLGEPPRPHPQTWGHRTRLGSQPGRQPTVHAAQCRANPLPLRPLCPLRWPTPTPGRGRACITHHRHAGALRGGGRCFSRASAGTYRPVYVLPDEEVEHRQRDVGQQLPQLPGQQHPQHAVLGRQVDPAPAHGHVRGVVADLLQGDRCHSDGQRNPPAEGRGISAAEVRPRPASKGEATEALPLGEPHCRQRPGEQGAGDSNPHPSLLCRSPAKPTPMPHSQPPSRPGCTCRWLGVAGAGSSRVLGTCSRIWKGAAALGLLALWGHKAQGQAVPGAVRRSR